MKVADHYSTFMGDCEMCGAWAKHEQVFSNPPHLEDWGQGGSGRFFEHLGPKGKTFYDKRSYKEHLRKEGLVEWSPRRKKGIQGGEV
jgi:hypothetical protein